MAQPNKGERAAILVRLDREIADRVNALDLVDRNAWIVAAIVAALARA